MADNKRWFKVWTSLLIDMITQDISLEDVGRFTVLGLLVCKKSNRGTLMITPETKKLFLKCEHLPEKFISDFNLISEQNDNDGSETVRFKNWNKYQKDSTGYARLKKWRLRHPDNAKDNGVDNAKDNADKTKTKKKTKTKIDYEKDILSEKNKFTVSKKAVENFLTISASRNKTEVITESKQLSLLCQLSVVLTEIQDEKIFNDALLEMTAKNVANINYLRKVIQSHREKGGQSGRSSESERGTSGKEETTSSEADKYDGIGEVLDYGEQTPGGKKGS